MPSSSRPPPSPCPAREARRSWLYRIRPSAAHGAFRRIEQGTLAAARWHRRRPTGCAGTRCRCPKRRPISLAGLATLGGNSAAEMPAGVAVHLYAANRSMQRAFYDADGELLIVPQQGALRIDDRMRPARCARPARSPSSRAGCSSRVALPEGAARGYVCENFGAALRLPDLGPIGANGLANPRDFLAPRRLVRGSRRTHRAGAEIPGHAVGDDARPFAARRGRLARQRRRRTNTTSRISTRSARSASTIPIRRSSPC